MATPRTLTRLQALLGAQAPINGVSVPTFGVSATVRIDFQAAATTQQRTNAQSVLTAFDWSDTAQQAWEDLQTPNLTTLRQNATTAVSNNTTFLGIASPTNAQAVAQVQALTTQMNQVIRYLGNL